jgi:hypothetical protein
MTTKKITLNELRSIVKQIIKEETEKGIIIGGKRVKSYLQNGDKSYNVIFDDGSKKLIYVSDKNGDWDKINSQDK